MSKWMFLFWYLYFGTSQRALKQRSSTILLKTHCPAEFSSNPSGSPGAGWTTYDLKYIFIMPQVYIVGGKN